MSNIDLTKRLAELPGSDRPVQFTFEHFEYIWYKNTLYLTDGCNELVKCTEGKPELIDRVWAILAARKFNLRLTDDTKLVDVLSAVHASVPNGRLWLVDGKYVVERESGALTVFMTTGERGRLTTISAQEANQKLNQTLLAWAAKFLNEDKEGGK